MAIKGQKFNKYSKKLKKEIMNKYLNNQGTSNYLSKEYNIPLKTVKTWIYKLNKNIDITKDYNYKKRRRKEENIDYKEKMYLDLSFTVIKVSNIHLLNTNPFVNLTE